MMGQWLPTPTDEVGMPLPLRPPDYPVLFNRPELFDRNHAFHPGNAPELDDMAGRALKNSRVQYVDWWDHHMVYHGTFEGPPLPTTRAGKFGLTVLAAALYIPDLAIDCREVDPVVIALTPNQKDRLWTSGEIRAPGPGIVRDFLTEYTLEQDLSHLKQSTIDEFVYTLDQERKRYLGHWLLSQAADRATEPIDLLYRQAWKLGRIPRKLPAKPCSVVRLQLGTTQHRDQVVVALRQRLATAA